MMMAYWKRHPIDYLIQQWNTFMKGRKGDPIQVIFVSPELFVAFDDNLLKCVRFTDDPPDPEPKDPVLLVKSSVMIASPFLKKGQYVFVTRRQINSIGKWLR